MKTFFAVFLTIILFLFCDSIPAENSSVKYIQRTMKTLSESSAEHPAHLRVMFYGQSIVAQNWTKQVEDFMRETWPTVEFEFRNAAIGGYTSPSLSRTAEADLYPWYPDLLFFHVYGPIDKYEEIVRKTRERTTAEIILWTSHLEENQDPVEMSSKRDQRSLDITAVAERQKCMLIDLNRKWCELLLEHQWKPEHLLVDNIHLNPEGCGYYADFIKEELAVLPCCDDFPCCGDSSEASGTIEEISAADECVRYEEDGSVVLTFNGNRVVAEAEDGEVCAEVYLDGRSMSGDPNLWAVTRASNGPVWMPAVNAIGWTETPVREDWILTALNGSAEDGSVIKYRVDGSVTGFDGEGVSNERFVSHSGRVVIEPEDFAAPSQFSYFKMSLPDDFRVTWSSYPLFADPYQGGAYTVLVQNCENGPHTLTIRPVSGKLKISKFIVNRPAAH